MKSLQKEAKFHGLKSSLETKRKSHEEATTTAATMTSSMDKGVNDL